MPGLYVGLMIAPCVICKLCNSADGVTYTTEYKGATTTLASFCSLPQTLCVAWCRIVCAAATAAPETVSSFSLTTKMKHRFLAVVDADIKVELSGTAEQRIVVFSIRPLSEASMMMVLDARGKLIYATSPLADLLGYPVKTLSKMDVKLLVPTTTLPAS